jgi:hypothetical protein
MPRNIIHKDLIQAAFRRKLAMSAVITGNHLADFKNDFVVIC